MPGSEYFDRQADICVRLSLLASDQAVSTFLIAMAQDYMAQDYMAQDYTAQADALSQSELVAIRRSRRFVGSRDNET